MQFISQSVAYSKKDVLGESTSNNDLSVVDSRSILGPKMLA